MIWIISVILVNISNACNFSHIGNVSNAGNINNIGTISNACNLGNICDFNDVNNVGIDGCIDNGGITYLFMYF